MSNEEKVEMEQVPLKSDTDAPATEATDAPAATEETPATEEVPAKKGGFRGLFTRTKKTTVVTTVETTDAPAEEEVAKEEKPKKKCWSFLNREKTECEQKAEQISIGVNLMDRDEKEINNHVKLDFHDIFGEADSAHSWDCAWRLLFKTFNWIRLFVYRLAALILGLPAVIVFGILFGLVTAINTFFCMPFGKLVKIPGTWVAKTWSWFVHSLIDPVASAVGLLFSSFTIRKYGINSQPTDPCVA